MAFRTKGTVRIELTEAAAGSSSTSLPVCKVLISPAQSHTVTVDRQDFILFIETLAVGSRKSSAVIWAKDTKFEVPDSFQPALRNAAAHSLCLEIDIESTSHAKIVGLVFPASRI